MTWTIWPEYTFPMTSESDEFLFNNAYCARVKQARLERGWTAEQMATALGIPPERYRKYENRSPLPPYLIERFALISGKDVAYVVTGRHSASATVSLTTVKRREA